jgi:hypothetical protein
MKKAVIALAIILVLAVAGSGAGFYIIYGELSSTQSDLQLTLRTVTDQNDLIDKNNHELSDLQSQLSTKDKLLEDNNHKLIDTKSLLDQANSEKQDLETQLESYQDGYNNARLQLDAVDKELQDAQNKIQLMKDTLGDVSSGMTPDVLITDGAVNNESRLFQLKRNPQAVNPTWDQLTAFLARDGTDQRPYISCLFTCGNYAEDIFNNAEAAGIRAAVVCITLKDEEAGHALNAFKTTDRGLIYIDCTGEPPNTPHPSMDTQADVKIGEGYDRHFIFPTDYYFEPVETVTSIGIFW